MSFIAQGTPKSVQASAKSKARWKGVVSSAAAKTLPSGAAPSIEDVRARIHFFFRRTDLDVDNIIKPILDAMNTIVYEDDRQIIDVIATKRDMAHTLTLQNPEPVLLQHMASLAGSNSDFVYVVVERADKEVLP